MENPLLKNRLWIIVTGMCLFSIFGISAQPTCIVGGTNFDTDWELCSPVFTNNNDPTTGSLPATITGVTGATVNNKVAAMMTQFCPDASNHFAEVSSAKHLPGVIQGNTMSTNDGNYPFNAATRTVWGAINHSGNSAGTTAIVANPRTLHAYLVNMPDNNMLVTCNSTNLVPFFTYTVMGLKPTSSVVFEADFYHLVSNWAVDFYVKSGAYRDYEITNGFGVFGNYNINGSTGAYAPASAVQIRIGSSIVGANNPDRMIINNGTNSANLPNGSTTPTRLSFTGTADGNGNITFYVARAGNANNFTSPIGMDNVVIRGDAQAQIASQKVTPVCQANPVKLYPRQNYPEGTTYEWSVNTDPPESGSSETFAFVPFNKPSYNVSLSIQMPGSGCAKGTSTFTLPTKECCTTVIDGVTIPLAETYIFFDDFGTFPTNSLYEWKDPDGTVNQVPTVGMWRWGPYNPLPVGQKPADLLCPGLPKGYWSTAHADPHHNVCAILYHSPYGGQLTDASGTGRGGMLFFGLQGNGFQNAILYQKEVCGLCKGKEITFGAKFAAANSVPSSGPSPRVVGILDLVLREGRGSTGRQLYSTGNVELAGGPGWKTAEHTWKIDTDETCVTLQVISRASDNGDGKGDFVIDDIFFSVCTPPEVLIDATVANGADPLNLCDDTDMTLKVEASDAITKFYEDIRYLFQYTYDDVTWHDLGTISNQDWYLIADPPSHPIFSSLQNGDKVNFRAIVGDRDYLMNNRSEWESMSAFNACRAVSISTFRFEAALNCVKCTASKNIAVSSTMPAPVESGIKTVNLCPGGSTTLTTNNIAPDITPAYSNYIITWYKGNKTTVTGTIADPGVTANSLTVSHSNATSVPVSEKYYVKVVDKAFPNSSSCIKWDSILIVSNPLPTAGITNNTGTTVLTCTDPTISLTATGGGTYSWSNGLGSNANVTVNAAGTYTVTVTTNGCTATESITITESKVLPTASITNNTGTTILTCITSSISLTATGGGTYSWNNGLGGNANATVTSAGTYTVTVTATNGCTATESITITENKTPPTAGITNNSATTVLTCTDPSISLTATGNGTYTWNNGLGSNADVTVTAPGVYTVIVMGSNGCMASSSITITEDGLLPTAGITNNTGTTVLTCTDPSISLTATGGSTYSWDNGLGSNANATVNAPGTYTVTATAANGCTATASITITENRTPPTAGITNNTSATELTCTLLSISLTATGGVSYSWDNGLGNNASATVISAGTYTVTVTGSNGCTATQSITITSDKGDVIAGITNNTGETVLTCTTPSISLTATGTGSYTWSNGLGSNANVTVNTPGTYTVTITATNGCADSKSITITEDRTPPAAGITNNTLTTVLTCTNPTISLTSTGGGTYSWNNSLGSNATVTVNTAGTYVATVTGSNGCTATASVTITENQTPPTAGITNNTSTTVLTCTTPSISLTATGGVSYLWDNSLGSNANATVNAQGTYTVTVTGANGCTATSSVTITENRTLPTAGITNNTSTTVLTCTTPSISLTATGGGTYSWNNSLGSNATVTVNTAGTYTVTVTGSNGCTATASVTITANQTKPSVDIINNSSTAVLSCTTPSISLTATGNGTYSWNNGLGTNATVTVATPGTYVVTVTGSNGCTETKSVTITSDDSRPAAVITTNTGTKELTCATSSIILTASGGTSYSWDNGLGNNANITVTSAGTYTVTVASANGCSDTESITITSSQSLPNISVTNADICLASQATLTASGSDSYTWNTGETGATITVSPAVTTTYTVEGTVTETGCKNTARATVYVESPIELTLTAPKSIELGNELTITITTDRTDHGYFEWFLNDQPYKTVSEYSLTLVPAAGRQHFLVHTVTTKLNCPSSSGIYVEVSESVPNAINPYDPSGRNCCFMIGYHVEIYNRYMQKVFEGSDGWDGTYRGAVADPGTYFYRLYKKGGQVEKGMLEVVKF